jgi:hypothetical protein
MPPVPSPSMITLCHYTMNIHHADAGLTWPFWTTASSPLAAASASDVPITPATITQSTSAPGTFNFTSTSAAAAGMSAQSTLWYATPSMRSAHSPIRLFPWASTAPKSYINLSWSCRDPECCSQDAIWPCTKELVPSSPVPASGNLEPSHFPSRSNTQKAVIQPER